MQPWHLTAALAGSAVLAALVVPTLSGSGAQEGVPPEPTPDPQVEIAPPVDTVATGLLHLSGELDQGAVLQGQRAERYLVFEVSADRIAGDVRRPVHLSVVVDTSGSMAGAGKITHAQMATRELAGLLRPEDTFSVVTFDDRATTRVLSGPVDLARVDRAVRAMVPSGGTNLYDGLQRGLQELDRPDFGGVKRVVVLSDGKATVGNTDPSSLSALAGSEVADGISVSALGLGLDYNEDLLASMSDLGGGTYRFVDQPGQLSRLFAEELHQMTAVAGREASLEVALPEGVELLDVYGWQHSVTNDGYRVFLGDVHGGETRKVVARVRVTAGSEASMGIATAALRYVDPEAQDTRGSDATIAATITPDTGVVRASLRPAAADKAAQAASAHYMNMGIVAYEKGNKDAQERNLQQAAKTLRDVATRTGNVELEAQAADYDNLLGTLGYTSNASDDGLYEVKKRKEAARVLSR